MANESATILRKIGFFHFGEGEQSDPPASLRAALSETSQQEDLTDSLIVVPEAFNIRNGYWSPIRYRDLLTKESLTKISDDFGVALVVGLIEEDKFGKPGFSSAYLIDRGVCRHLSRKEGNDGSGTYKPCQGGWDRPVLHRGVCIGALICMDAGDFNSPPKKRHEALLEQLGACTVPNAVLCVPARMGTYGSKEVAQAWPTHLAVVVGNSGSSQPSVIRYPGERAYVDPVSFGGARNKVRVVALV